MAASGIQHRNPPLRSADRHPTSFVGLPRPSQAVPIARATSDILEVFRNYRGERQLHIVAKTIVKKLSEGDARLSSVEILLENTGVVSGEFGMVEAMRERKALMTEWLKDGDARIQSFASTCIRHLDNRIATEQREAEMRKEQRKRDYDG